MKISSRDLGVSLKNSFRRNDRGRKEGERHAETRSVRAAYILGKYRHVALQFSTRPIVRRSCPRGVPVYKPGHLRLFAAEDNNIVNHRPSGCPSRASIKKNAIYRRSNREQPRNSFNYLGVTRESKPLARELIRSKVSRIFCRTDEPAVAFSSLGRTSLKRERRARDDPRASRSPPPARDEDLR